jgi:hypothetical protein
MFRSPVDIVLIIADHFIGEDHRGDDGQNEQNKNYN